MTITQKLISAIISVVLAGLITGCGYIFAQPAIKPHRLYLVLPGDHPDPSIVRDGNDFYLTHSSFKYTPALPIWHSKDLLHWNLLTYALNHPPGEIWAPDFVKYNGKFYIYFPAAGTNWIITADSPLGPWSLPVDLKLAGIDPGHIAAPDGKRYLFVNGSRVVSLADDGLSVTSQPLKVYDGWPIPPDWTIECFCDESPKLFYKDGFYYLTTAQGGTAGPATSHMAVSARAPRPLGPFQNSPFNPIVHTFSSDERWWCKGHATVFDDARGNWYIIYHAYEKNNLPLGRQVIIEPLEWTADGWFRLTRNPQLEPPTQVLPNAAVESDNFEQPRLKLQWQFTGLNALDDAQLVDGRLRLKAVPDRIRIMHAITPDRNYQTAVKLEPLEGTEAGLIVYYNDSAFAGLAIDANSIFIVTDGKRPGPEITRRNVKYLRLTLKDYNLSFAYSSDGRRFIPYPDGLEISAYHHNMLKGFSSIKIAIYTKGTAAVLIDDFKYHPLYNSP